MKFNWDGGCETTCSLAEARGCGRPRSGGFVSQNSSAMEDLEKSQAPSSASRSNHSEPSAGIDGVHPSLLGVVCRDRCGGIRGEEGTDEEQDAVAVPFLSSLRDLRISGVRKDCSVK